MSAHTGPVDLRNHNILITGAGDGFGRALACQAAAAGAQVLLLGRTLRKLEAVYDSIIATGGSTPILVPGDLATLDADAAEAVADAVRDQIGVLHGLVHNAAELGQRVPLQYYDPNQWQQVLHVNLTAPFLLTRALLPALLAADAARILFLSSSVGIRGGAYWGAYSVSKFGLEGLAQVLRNELENTSRVRVHVVNPGRMRTAMRAAAYPAEDVDSLPLPAALAAATLPLLDIQQIDPREQITLQPGTTAPEAVSSAAASAS